MGELLEPQDDDYNLTDALRSSPQSDLLVHGQRVNLRQHDDVRAYEYGRELAVKNGNVHVRRDLQMNHATIFLSMIHFLLSYDRCDDHLAFDEYEGNHDDDLTESMRATTNLNHLDRYLPSDEPHHEDHHCVGDVDCHCGDDED